MKNNKQSIFNIDSFYVIGDIHGQSLKLLEVIKEIEDVDKNPFLIFVGDILGFDGDNLKTLEVISDLKKKYKGKVYVIEGNHDNFFKLDITEGFQRGYIKKIKNLHPLDLTTMSPSDLIRFLNEKKVFHVFEEMIPYFETKNALITHAPIPFNSWNFFSKGFKGSRYGDILDKMLWEIRTSFELSENQDLPNMSKFLICGHQHLVSYPNKEVHKRPRIFSHRAYLDCGCGYRKESKLFAIHFPSKKVFSSK